jgi:hypothetical protein
VPPPLDSTPQTAHAVVTVVTGLVALGFLLYALRVWRRRGTPVYVVLLAAGLLCVVNEIPLSWAGHFYYPRPDAWEAFEMYGRIVPVWAVFAYTIYCGGLSIAMCEWLRGGVTRARVWIGVLVVGGLDAILEVTVLRTDNYIYYGQQPLRIDRFPSIWMAMNVIAVLGTAAVLGAFPQWFTGRNVWRLLLVLPLCQVAGDWLGTPHFVMLNSGKPEWAMRLGTLLAMASCALAVDAIAKALAARSVAGGLTDTVEDVDEVGPVLAGRAG